MPEIGKNVEVVDHDVADVIVEMAAGATLSGRVEPPGVATLSIAPEQIGLGNLFDAAKAAFVRGDSDATGAFTLHHVPAGAFTLAAATHEGRAGKLAITVTDADQLGLVVTLAPRAALVGRVVDASHAPVAGLQVAVEPATPFDPMSAVSFSIGGRSAGVVTGDDGAFRAVGLEPGKVHVTVLDERGPLAWVGRDKPHEPLAFDLVVGQDTAAGTLVVEASDGVIHGTVVGADGSPAADAWVTAHLVDAALDDPTMIRARMMAMDMDEQLPALTGADGKFTLSRLRHGSYDLVAEGPRGASRADKKGVKAGDTVTLTLASLGTLTGHVTAGGAPVATFDIECKGTVTASRHVTAADGTYTLEHMAPGHYACDATAATGTALGSADVPTGPVTLDLVIVPWASATGIVVSALTGAPLAGLKVFAQGAGNQMTGITAMLTGGGPTTDATGRFVVDQLGAGSGTLLILPASGAFDALATRPLALVAGQRLDLGVLKVVPPREGDAGTLGLGTSVDGGALVVASVKAGGPAEQAGVAVGDKIVTINGAAVSDITAAVAKDALGSGSIGVGQVFALGLDRAGTPVQATVTSVKW